MNLIFLGPPGAGKGTTAVDLKERLAIPHISTGDLFRAHIKGKTELGLQVSKIIEAGDLVPDEITIEMVKLRLAEADAQEGYILDGFPRTTGQAEALEGFATIDRVINLVIADEEIVKRLSGRRVCKSCGYGHHVEFMPPKEEGVCDKCSGELYTRKDDQIDAITNRLEVYKKSTQPLIDFYKEKGLLTDFDSSKKPGEVTNDVEAFVKTL